MSLKTTTEAYEKVFKVIEENLPLIDIDIEALQARVNSHKIRLELMEVYGLNISSDIKNLTYENSSYLKNNVLLIETDGIRGRIYKEDNNRQSVGEKLIMICLRNSSGLSFNCHKRFFEKLKTYNPDYISTVYDTLYFKLENAKEVFNAYDSIYQKYLALDAEDDRNRKITTIQENLKDLQEELDLLTNT